MILIYQWEEDLMELKLYSCAPNLDIQVDHLYFSLEIHHGLYKEEFDGVVTIKAGDDQDTLAARVKEIYAQALMNENYAKCAKENSPHAFH